MNTLEKELISVAVSIAAGCEPCTSYHVASARAEGAGDAALTGMAKIALSVRERATQKMASVALETIGAGEACAAPCCCGGSLGRLEALASAASALAANCGSGVPGFLAAARDAGADERDGELALALARKIKKVAAEKAELHAKGQHDTAPGAACAQAGAADCRGSACC